MRSRWAPASEPPSRTSGSSHSARRSSQSASRVGAGQRPQHRPEVVGGDDVDDRGERVLAPLGRDVADEPVAVRLVGLGEDVADHVAGEVGQPAQGRRGRTRSELARTSGSCSRRIRLGHVHREHVAPAGEEPQGAEREEAHVVVGEHRHGQRHHPAADLSRARRDGAAGARPGPASSADAPRTFQLSGRPAMPAHLGEELDLVVVEPPDAPLGDQLQRRSVVLRRRPRTTRAPRPPTPTGWAPAGRRRRCGSTTGSSTARARRRRATGRAASTICVELVGVGLPARSPRRARSGASAQWPTMNPAFTRDRAVERVQVLAEALPSPRHARPRARRAAFPRPGPSSGGCSRRRAP